MKRSLYILIIICFIPLLLPAKEYDLSIANRAYQEQDYTAAKAGYMKLVDQGVVNYELFYNLGNTCFKLNELGNARLFYEKAAKFKPLDDELNDNISILMSRMKDKEVVERSFIETLLRKVYYIFPINILGILVLIFFILMMAFIVLLILSRSMIFKQIMKIFLVIFAVIFFLTTIAEIMRIQDFYAKDSGVILEGTVIAYSGPSEDFPQVFTIHEGLKVSLERFDNDWVLIKLPSGNGGWVLRSSLGII